ncbi:MAG TPA: copper resistance protein CopC [Chloroflexia bacterium]|nr:copper resistance protein CopC [Chloroflexia bacterium]
MRIRSVVVVALAVLLLWLLPAGAGAHSLLVSSTPTAGAQLPTPPGSVNLVLSEGAVPEFSSVVVLDRARRHYETGTPAYGAQGIQVRVTLEPNLPPGVYIVQWKAVSSVDGHLTRGSFPFTVLGAPGATPAAAAPAAPTPAGPAPAPAPPEPETPGDTSEFTRPGPLDIAVRWLGSLLAALLLGGAVFRLLVVPAALARLPDGRALLARDLNLRLVVGSLTAAWLLLLTLIAELLLQGARVTESDVFAVLARHSVLPAVLATDYGWSLELRALSVLAIFLLLVVELATDRLRGLVWGAVALVGAEYFLAATLSAHATALSQTTQPGLLQQIAPAANVVHLLVSGIWVGGIFAFVLVLLPAARGLAAPVRAAVLRGSIARFSAIALVTVPLVAASGTLLYLAASPSVQTTLDTDYGRAVLVKVALLGMLLVPAAYNLRRVGPGLARLRETIEPGLAQLAGGFRRAIRLEAGLVSVVLIAAAILTLTAPATDPATVAHASPPTLTPGPVAQVATATPLAAPLPTEPLSTTLTLTQTVRGVEVALTTGHSAVDEVVVALRDVNGPVQHCLPTPAAGVDCVLSVKLTFTQLDDNTSFSVAAEDAGAGRFAVPTGPYMALDGNWQILVVVRRRDQPLDLKAAYRYVVAGNTHTGRLGEYLNVDVATDPSRPRSGPVSFVFRLTDSNGQPITDATVTMQGIMPTHGHVTVLTPLQNSQGAYAGRLLMPMSGGWSVDLTIARPGRDTLVAEVDLDLDPSEFDLTPYPSPNITPGTP